MGCFGVLAAVVAVVVGVPIWLAMMGHLASTLKGADHPSGQSIMAGTETPFAYQVYCANAFPQVKARHARALKGVTFDADTPPTVSRAANGLPLVGCWARHAKGPVAFHVVVSCEDLAGSCTLVQSTYLRGRRLDWDRD